MALTEKQKRFVDEYLIDLNATRAYKVSYPKVKKDNVAAANGARMLRNDRVAEYISERMQEREKRTEVTQDMVIRELAAIAFSNASDFARVIEKPAVITAEDGTRISLTDEDGKPLLVKDVELVLTDKLSEEQKKALAGIKRGKYGIEVTSCDKVRALELLGRHLGMFKDKVDVTVEETTKLDDIMSQIGGGGLEE